MSIVHVYQSNNSLVNLTNQPSPFSLKSSNSLDLNENQPRCLSELFTDLKSCDFPSDHDSDSSNSNEDDQRINRNSLSIREDRKSNRTPQKIASNNSSSDSSDEILNFILTDVAHFVFSSLPQKDYLRCYLIRRRSTSSETIRLEVQPEGNRKSICLLMATKETNFGQTRYLIAVMFEKARDVYSAELISADVTGTIYTLYSLHKDSRRPLANIKYEVNFVGCRGPRRMEVILLKLKNRFPSINSEDEIEQQSTEDDEALICLRNQIPSWDSAIAGHFLRFDGPERVVLPSVKNFQLVMKKEQNAEEIVMQFCRSSANEFVYDVRSPLSLIQSFAIALTSLESRWWRE